MIFDHWADYTDLPVFLQVISSFSSFYPVILSGDNRGRLPIDFPFLILYPLSVSSVADSFSLCLYF